MILTIRASSPTTTMRLSVYEQRGAHDGIWFRVGHWPGDLAEIAAHPCFELMRSLYMVLVWGAEVQHIELPSIGRVTVWTIEEPGLPLALFATSDYPGPLEVWSIMEHMEREAPGLAAHNLATAHRPEGLT